MNKLKLLPLINTTLIISLALFYIFNTIDKKETIVYVDSIKLFNEFHMTKEIRVSQEMKINKKKRTLDSLFNQYQNIADKESKASKKLEQKFSYFNNELQNIQNNYTTNLTQQVWSRLDSYLKEYGKKNQLKLILGNNSSGIILYSDNLIDVTTEVLEFVNLKYDGNLIKN